ncbi:MAG TPA: crosslink repair DNA glycosylase YcaQ family protein [Streptosporangiaceae bacterium]|nr:crosslink repair DNA glycosylase YcaQ family protein [Streptosporangiaceae bacterium]
MAGPVLPAPQLTLTPDEARIITLRAQGFIGAEARRGGVPAMLRRLGAVQLDTISVLARSHELVAYARLGAIPRAQVERAYWQPRQPASFEYWSHAACLLPLEEWPFYAFRRRAFARRGLRWHQSHPEVCARVLARIRAEGPLTATELGGAKTGSAWWDWSDTKIAVEWLLDTGDVICVRRAGWRRVYDLPERVLSPGPSPTDLPDAECIARLAGVAAKALGVVTAADLSDYQRVRYNGAELRGSTASGPVPTAAEAAEAAGLIPVQIASGRGVPAQRAWLDPAAVQADDNPGSGGARRGRHRTTLLSPFDSLVWDRKRTLRVFGFEHSLEAYIPQAKRVHGYFTMPLLAGGRLVGRVDPARTGTTLIARKLSLDKPAAAEPMAQALVEATAWVGCDSVKLQQVEPAHLEPRLRSALSEHGA